MKTNKIKFGLKHFFYEVSKTNRKHGFFNNKNVWIGYFYQNKEKGFWLDYRK
jgi:hypothetical protein